MHALTMSALLTMAHFAPLGLTAPDTNPVLATRTDYCANAPHTVAGTFLNARDMELKYLISDNHAPGKTPTEGLTARASGPQNVLWCGIGTRTYILVSIADMVSPEESMAGTLERILDGASAAVYDHIVAVGDGTILGGKFQWPPGELSMSQLLFLKVWNANNHQLTWGVLHSSIAAIASFMNTHGWGVGHFDIYDGGIRVGYGIFT